MKKRESRMENHADEHAIIKDREVLNVKRGNKAKEEGIINT